MFLNVSVLQGRVVSTSPNPQAEGPPLVGCPRRLIQFIRSYPPYKVLYLKVSVLLFQFFIFYSIYTIFGERTVSQVCRGQQIYSRTGPVKETEDTGHFSQDAHV